jgi:hypothetical protein
MIAHKIVDDEYFQHLHALAITTAVEQFGGAKLITVPFPAREPAPASVSCDHHHQLVAGAGQGRNEGEPGIPVIALKAQSESSLNVRLSRYSSVL